MFPGSPDAHANCKVLAGPGARRRRGVPRAHSSTAPPPPSLCDQWNKPKPGASEVTQTSISLGQGGQVDIHGGIELTGRWPLSAVKGTSYIRKVRCSTLPPINEKEGMLQRGSPGNKQKERNSNEKHVCLRCESWETWTSLPYYICFPSHNTPFACFEGSLHLLCCQVFWLRICASACPRSRKRWDRTFLWGPGMPSQGSQNLEPHSYRRTWPRPFPAAWPRVRCPRAVQRWDEVFHLSRCRARTHPLQPGTTFFQRGRTAIPCTLESIGIHWHPSFPSL